MISHLSWDSDFFGLNVGLLTIESYDQYAENFKKNDFFNFDLVYIFTKDKHVFNIFQSNSDFLFVDNKVTYSKHNLKYLSIDPNIISFPVNHKPNNNIVDIALQAGEYSRFRMDHNFPKDKYRELYTLWIDNSIKRKIAKEVFVYELDSNKVGLITLGIKNNIPDIGLIAIDKTYRGLSIGSKLIAAAENWAYNQMNSTSIQVVTQGANTSACKFYEKNGYSITKQEYIFHWWKKLSK